MASDFVGSFLVLFVLQEKRTAEFFRLQGSLKNFITDDGTHLFARFFFGRKSDLHLNTLYPVYFFIFH